MSTISASQSPIRPGFRLKQTPVDKWSIREKLALASSVHRSGDQNWYSVSRSIKYFGEPNRPSDWFSQKNCALQYSELLENVETPKRKRGERGENTAQDLIVLELQQKRIDELKEILAKERSECAALRDELELIKSGKADPNKFKEIWERMKKEENDKEAAEEEHKKWLVEREAKIALMKANRHLALTRSPKSAKSSQVTSPSESDSKGKSDVLDKSAEPLTVKIEPVSTDTENSLSTAPQTPTPTAQSTPTPQQLQLTVQTPEKPKITPLPVISSPSTSPLLTHLLQSPSPSASGTVPYNIISPSTLKDMQQKTSPSTTHFFPSNITSPTLSGTPLSASNQSIDQLPSTTIDDSKIASKEISEPSSSIASVCGSSPTLSKLLETSPTTSVKASPLSTKESSENVPQDGEMMILKDDNSHEVSGDVLIISERIEAVKNTMAEPINENVTVSQIPVVSNVDESQLSKNDNQTVIQSRDEAELSSRDPTPATLTKEISEPVVPAVNVVQTLPGFDTQQQLTSEIKQELIEPEETMLETPMEIDSKIIKIEDNMEPETNQVTPMNSKSAISTNSSVTASRKRKRPPLIVTTPLTTPTRRSNRVRKDKTSSEEEQLSIEETGFISNTTAPTTPLTTVPIINTTTSTGISAVNITVPSSGGKKIPVSTSSVLPPPLPPPSVSTENSTEEESTDNTNISLAATLIKPSTSAPTTAPTSKASSVTESAPNSPASAILTAEEIENQKEYKMWKKSIMLLWRQAATHKFSTLFAHPVTDSEAKGYSTVVYRPIDLLSIRKKIENGQIKTTAEFQRDMMLMFQNAIMYNSVDHDVHQMAVEMQKEILEGIEDFIETQQKTPSSSNEPTKPRGRRSNVSTSSDAHDPESAELRRRKRVSTDTEPIASTSTPTSKSKTKKKPPIN